MSEWIKVEEDKPETDGRYLVCESGVHWCWIGVCSLRNGEWDSKLVTHWQPLPEAPE